MSRGYGKRQRAILDYLANTDEPVDLHTIIADTEGLELRHARHSVFESYRRGLKRLCQDEKVYKVGSTRHKVPRKGSYWGQWSDTPTYQLPAIAIPKLVEDLTQSIESSEKTANEGGPWAEMHASFLPSKRARLERLNEAGMLLSVERRHRHHVATFTSDDALSVEGIPMGNLSTHREVVL